MNIFWPWQDRDYMPRLSLDPSKTPEEYLICHRNAPCYLCLVNSMCIKENSPGGRIYIIQARYCNKLLNFLRAGESD